MLSLVEEIRESVADLAVIVRKYSEWKPYCGCYSYFPDNHVLSGLLRVYLQRSEDCLMSPSPKKCAIMKVNSKVFV